MSLFERNSGHVDHHAHGPRSPHANGYVNGDRESASVRDDGGDGSDWIQVDPVSHRI